MNIDQKFDWKLKKLERAHEQEPEDPKVTLKLAEAYFQKGYYLGKGSSWFELAIGKVQDSIDQGFATSESFTLLANSLYGREKYDAAGEAYRRALELDPRNALAMVGLGNLEKRRGDFEKARELFQRAVEAQADLWQAHYNLGGAYYQEARARGLTDVEHLLDKAIYHLVRALKLKPFENFVGNIHKDLGELFLHTQQYAHARRFFNRLLRFERYEGLAHYYLGLTHYALGKYNLAIQNYRNYLRFEPQSAVAHAKIGLAYLELRQYPRAREACQDALAIDVNNVLAHFTIGCSYLDERNLSAAQQTFEYLLELTPDYFPAYVELVKTHFYGKDYDWLLEQFRQETRLFEQSPGYDGGRSYYTGPRGDHRHKIDVLLAQLREAGPRPHETLLEALRSLKSDSLRFQLWEELLFLATRSKLEEVINCLRNPEVHFSKQLGRTILLLSQHLSEDLLMDAFRGDEDRIRRAALNRLKVKDDIGAYKQALEQTRAEYIEFQAFLLRALASKGSPEAEHFLLEAMSRPERALRLSAAVALTSLGNERAIDLLEQESADLPEAERERVEELLRIGREKYQDMNKVIRLTDLHERSRARAQPPPRREDPRQSLAPSSCALCGRGQREVERMLAGSRLMICTQCVRELWKDRPLIRSVVQKDIYCSFCRRSVFEADNFYTRGAIHICNLCLDLSMGVLEREEVDRFLQDLS